MRAVKGYLVQEMLINKVTSSADHVILTPEEEAAEIQQAIELNNAWNASIAEIRNQRLEKVMNERQEYILSRLELKREREEEAMRVANEAVRLEKVEILFRFDFVGAIL